MQAALKSLPPLFAAIPDPQQKPNTVKLTCRMSDDGKKLAFTAVTTANITFSTSYDDGELTKVKDGADSSQSWDAFFKGLQKAFGAKNDISIAMDGGNAVNCKVKLGGAAPATFALRKQSDSNGTMTLLEQLYGFYERRVSKNTADNQLQEATKKEEEAKKKVQQLEDEKKEYLESQERHAKEEQEYMSKLEALRSELKELSDKHKQETGDDVNALDEPLEPDFSPGLGFCRIPLGDKDKRELNKELMTLMKSKFTPLEGDANASAPHVKLITPLNKNEFASQIKGLQDGEIKTVMDYMNKINDWDFNVFAIGDVTNRGSLFYVAYGLFLRYDFLRKFNLDEEILINFLSQIEAGYHPNPYHNSMHAADVAHIVHFIMSPGGLRKTAELTDEDTFAAILAGMIHDYDHPGINNGFHVKVQSYLATLYNDRSILENHHCAEVFELMKIPRFNLLGGMSDEQRRDIRETVIEMVLSTDMGLHAKIVGTWKKRISQDTNLHERKDDQRLALALAIKMADISNCGRPESIYLKWTNKLFEEFFLQGDIERNIGNPVSPFMDRYVPSMAKSQVAFMNYIVIPMFESISEYLPDMHFTVNHCEENKAYWADNDDTV
eukprot:TRINITY_DN94266_c0_g1_i1.p1 TRINITY_DN94266_c0_g1~~TRINITY_DN94266_c0_g1_i1.p1  ORF type:complete len:610 (-),score=112.52 TRINITY_DN94266_c0_g1_i1:173-2002(-)